MKFLNNKKFIIAISVIVGLTMFLGIAILANLFRGADLPVQIAGALLEAAVTASITYFLLAGQTEQAEEKERQVKIYEEKIKVYSEFIEKMWEIVEKNAENDAIDHLKELRKICFRQLIFFLNDKQIEEISKLIKEIEEKDAPAKTASEITRILQDNLHDKENNKNTPQREYSRLLKLYQSFSKTNIIANNINPEVNIPMPDLSDITYWHFNMLDERQIDTLKNNNWVLALIEYSEEWRTNLLTQVNPGDVIFLFKRGGSGYIGAFKATGTKILYAEEHKNSKYSAPEIEKYDIYGGLEDGATLCSNIIVEPIAYNYCGVGYKTARRRTIERINDIDSVKLLLNRFNGNDLDEEVLIGIDKLDENTPIKNLNTDYFSKITNLVTTDDIDK
jgi:hypothetical protein